MINLYLIRRMKRKYIGILPGLLCLTLSLVLLTSCDDDDDKNSGQIELLSFGPSGVLHGEQIKLIGNNLDKVTAVIMPVGVEVPSSAFDSQSSEVITFKVPLETGFGRITLKTPQGDIESKSIYSPDAPIVIASITEEAKPGTNITITGEFLNFVTSVWFTGGVEVTEFVSQSRTELVVTVPLEAKTGKVSLQRTATLPEALTVDTEEPLTVTLPTITNISPLSLHHTEELTIEGTDLDLVTSISLEGDINTSDFVSQSESQIVLQIPVGALSGLVTLHQPSEVDVVSADPVEILLPVGDSFTPKPAEPGVDNITISGERLDLIVSLGFANVTDPIPSTDFVSQSPTQIVVAVPADATAGPITYTTEHGYTANLGLNLTVPVEGPAPLDYVIYDDGLKNGWGEWDGWEVTKDFASTEEVLVGTTAIKATYSGQYGAIQLGSPAADDCSGYSTLSFSVYAPAQQDFIIQIGDNADTYINIPAGWSEVNISIADMAGNDNVGELRFKNNNANLPVTLYFDEIGLRY